MVQKCFPSYILSGFGSAFLIQNAKNHCFLCILKLDLSFSFKQNFLCNFDKCRCGEHFVKVFLASGSGGHVFWSCSYSSIFCYFWRPFPSEEQNSWLFFFIILMIWAATWDFQQCGILTCVDSDEPVQPPFKLRNSKWCSINSLTVIEYSSD